MEALEDRAEEVVPRMGAHSLAEMLDSYTLLARPPSKEHRSIPTQHGIA